MIPISQLRHFVDEERFLYVSRKILGANPRLEIIDAILANARLVKNKRLRRILTGRIRETRIRFIAFDHPSERQYHVAFIDFALDPENLASRIRGFREHPSFR